MGSCTFTGVALSHLGRCGFTMSRRPEPSQQSFSNSAEKPLLVHCYCQRTCAIFASSCKGSSASCTGSSAPTHDHALDICSTCSCIEQHGIVLHAGATCWQNLHMPIPQTYTCTPSGSYTHMHTECEPAAYIEFLHIMVTFFQLY